MKKTILLLTLIALVASAALWYVLGSKKQKNDSGINEHKLTVKKHSVAFNTTVNEIISQYMLMKNAFVDSDTASVKTNTQKFIRLLDQIDTLELKKDTQLVVETVIHTIKDMKSNASAILNQHDITQMRKDFSSLSDVMYPSFFVSVNYQGQTLFVQQCPMAFYDTVPANWISNSEEIVNPYLGKNHPVYKAGMLHCGEVLTTIKSKQ
jgi:hypothetical protein